MSSNTVSNIVTNPVKTFEWFSTELFWCLTSAVWNWFQVNTPGLLHPLRVSLFIQQAFTGDQKTDGRKWVWLIQEPGVSSFSSFFPMLLSFDLSSYCNQPSVTKAWRTSTQGPLCVWFLQEHLPHSVCCLSQNSKLKFISNKSAAQTLIKTVISFYLLHQMAQSPTTLPHIFSAALSLVVAACWTVVCLQSNPKFIANNTQWSQKIKVARCNFPIPTDNFDKGFISLGCGSEPDEHSLFPSWYDFLFLSVTIMK